MEKLFRLPECNALSRFRLNVDEYAIPAAQFLPKIIYSVINSIQRGMERHNASPIFYNWLFSPHSILWSMVKGTNIQHVIPIVFTHMTLRPVVSGNSEV